MLDALVYRPTMSFFLRISTYKSRAESVAVRCTRNLRLETPNLGCKEARGKGDEHDENIETAVKHVTDAHHKLTLARQEINKLPNNQNSSAIRRLKLKILNALRAISGAYPLEIPDPLTKMNFKSFLHELKQKFHLGVRDSFSEEGIEEYTVKSPRDFATILDADLTTREVVKQLFEQQYDIKWNTPTGDPDQFSFYVFCHNVDEGIRNKFLTYNIRKAHVMIRLYQAQEKLHKIRDLHFKELCPPVYVRGLNSNSWAKWAWDEDSQRFKLVQWMQDINWITNKDLKDYITENSLRRDGHQFPSPTMQLYWAVLEENDHELDNNPVPMDGYRRTQIYAGKAKNGIIERWPGSSSSSHCKRMEFTRDVLCNMVSYDPTALASVHLVALRLLLHKACIPENGEDKSGLFIMNECDNEDVLKAWERNNLRGKTADGATAILPNTADWKPRNMKYGMNYDYLNKY